MQNVKAVGGDIGNDAVKIYFEEPNYKGESKFEVMNVIAPGHTRRMLKKEEGHLSNLLDINIEIAGKDIGRYFVGGLAFKENQGDYLEKTKQDIKATNIDSVILLMTTIAYGLYDPNNPIKSENIALGALLPTEEYFADEQFTLVDKFDENLKKQFKIKFNSPAFNKSEITLNIIDSDIKPEGAAGHIASVYNMDGSLKKGMEKFEHEMHLGIFIGSITTEVSVFENGEFNPNGFFGIPLGTSDPLDKIRTDLGVQMSRHQIDHYIRTKKPLIANINGETKDLTETLKASQERRFDYFIKLLINRIYSQLSDKGINTSLISQVNLGGGGGITSFESFKREFNLKNVNLVEDARYANALGALASIVQKLKEQNAAAEEVLS